MPASTRVSRILTEKNQIRPPNATTTSTKEDEEQNAKKNYRETNKRLQKVNFQNSVKMQFTSTLTQIPKLILK